MINEYERLKSMMSPQIYEDVERGKCQRDIVNLSKKFEKDVEELIERHTVKFKGRKPTEKERNFMLYMADYILKLEQETINEWDH